MQQKLQDEYMKLRLKFYKKVVINASFYIENIISNRIKSVDRKVALKSLKKFTVKYSLEDFLILKSHKYLKKYIRNLQ